VEGSPRWLILAYLLLVASAVIAAEFVFRRFSTKSSGSAQNLVWAATFVVLTGLGFGLMLLRQIGAARGSERALNRTNAALRAMSEVAVIPLGPFDLTKLLSETLARASRTLEAEVGAVYLTGEDGRLAKVATLGDQGDQFDRRMIESVARSLKTAEGVQDHTGDGPSPRTLAQLISPLVSGDHALGVIAVGSARRQRYSELDAGVLELVADRLGAAVERDRLVDRERRSRLAAERARGLLAVLNQAADALAPAVESYDAALNQLVDHVVPAFADWFAVDLTDPPDGSLRPAAGGYGDGDVLALGGGENPETWKEWREFLTTIMTDGAPHLAYASDAGTVVSSVGNPGLMVRLGAASYLIVPIRVRGLSFGTLSFATRTGRRGFRPSDVPPAEALAERVAVTVERVMTYGEAREAEQAARRQAMHLRRLSAATLAVSAAPLSQDEILAVVADQARLLTSAEGAVAAVAEEGNSGGWVASPTGGKRASHPHGRLDQLVRDTNRLVRSGAEGSEPAGSSPKPSWMAAPLTTADGANRGSVVVTRDGPSFTTDEESVLLSLAQLASVAFDKLRLYQEVQEGQARLEILVDSSPVAIVELTTAGVPVRWNRTAEDLLTWPAEPPAPGISGGTSDGPEDGFASLWERTARGEAIGATDGVLHRPDGSSVDISVTTAPLRTGDGRVGAVLAVLEDVSARRRVEEQMNRSERMDAMGRLAGAVAHDFNNLLTVILGYNDLLAQRLGDSPLAADIAAVRAAAQRAAELTNQLLDIGRQQVSAPRAVDIGRFVSDMEPVLARLVGTGCALQIETDRQFIFIDPSRLERVVLNLVLNAADAMSEGGSLFITTGAVEVGPENAALARGKYVQITVRDTGAGMDQFAVEHCFDPFFTTKDRSKGTGLGLAAVYGIVTQSDGEITVHSQAGEGTTFTILLPAVAPTEVSEPEAEVVSVTRISGVERILLVEDQEDVRRLLRDELARNGYSVVDVADGPASLFTADEEGPFDLLVTDVIMPGMSGTEVARRLAPTGIPVLFVSGHVDDELRSELDPDADLLSKPFSPQVLLERVRQALDRAAAQGSKR
jgi:signal transduction histidine kinase/CheY-like chemotaxis protein